MNVLIAELRHELRHRRDRALLVALAVLLGAAAVAAAFGARDVLGRAIPASYAASLPPDLVLATGDLTARALSRLRERDEVSAVEPRAVRRARIAGADGHPISLRLVVLPDLDEQRVSRVVAHGAGRDGLLLERSGVPLWAGEAGDPMTLRLPGGREATLPTAGLAADGAVAPGVQDRIVYAYVTPGIARANGLPVAFDELHVRLAAGTDDEDAAIDALLAHLAAVDLSPTRVERVPGRHPHGDQMAAVLLLLGVFALAALLVATALVTSVTATRMRQERLPIGVARALGASRRRVVGTVLLWLAIIAVPSALAGTALGAAAARAFGEWAAEALNLLEPDPATRPSLLLLAASLGTALPLGLAAASAWRTASGEPLDAIFPDRTTPPPARRPRILGERPLAAWAARATLARLGRLVLTVFALALGGTSLLCAGHLHQSLSSAVERAFAARSDDIDIRLLAPLPRGDLQAALAVEGVVRGEVWGALLVAIAETHGPVSGSRFGLLAPPPDTTLLTLPLAEGRWLGDPRAFELVASRNLLAREPSLALGQETTIAYGDARVEARLVGIVEEATEPGLYASAAVHDALVGDPALGGALRVVARGESAAVADRIEAALFAVGALPALAFERAELMRATTDHFVILLVLLATVAAVALLVGALGLAASIAASLVERRREIAMVRAIGASDARLLALVLGETVVLVGLAVALSLALSLPLSAALAARLGTAALHVAVPLHVSPVAVVVWVIAAVVLGALAAALPLRRALAPTPAMALAHAG